MHWLLHRAYVGNNDTYDIEEGNFGAVLLLTDREQTCTTVQDKLVKRASCSHVYMFKKAHQHWLLLKIARTEKKTGTRLYHDRRLALAPHNCHS